ncbi:DUF2188 domain-containing protein [Amycolatopsis sp. cmx-4-54]|uniref:DUF2188 domain-containing protein n=1 Tax=Amycolatopsis sp. cmx-4-54 TaxID=2790936 RepID=UPI00397B411C
MRPACQASTSAWQQVSRGGRGWKASHSQWKNKVEGSTRAASTHYTKADAIDKGRVMARERKVEHFIRNQNGQVGERNTYGHDPRNVPG